MRIASSLVAAGFACLWLATPIRAQDAVLVDGAAAQVVVDVAAADVEAEAEDAKKADDEEAAEANEDKEAPAAEVAAEAVAVDAVVVEAQAVQVFNGVFNLQVPAAAVAPADGNAEDANLAPYLAQFRPLLKAELSFANRVCELSAEQRKTVVDAGKAWLKDYVRQYVQQQGQPQAVGVAVFLGGVRRAVGDNNPRKAIEDGIGELVKKNVNDAQRTTYEAEMTKRAEFRKQVVLDNLLAKIDSRLYLAPDQRQSLAESMGKKWDDSWAPAMDTFVHMGDYLPQIPDEHIVPLLNDQQKSVWNGVQKVNYGNSFGGDNNWIDGGQQLNDIDLGE